MGKAALILGVVGSVIAGLLLSSRLVHQDLTASVSESGKSDSCPTLAVRFDKFPVPPELTKCPHPDHEHPMLSRDAVMIYPPAELVSAAAPSDQISIAYTEFTSPLSRKKQVGLSFTLFKGSDKLTWVASSPWPAYSSFALLTLAPFGAGVLLAILALFLPKKEKGTGSFS